MYHDNDDNNFGFYSGYQPYVSGETPHTPEPEKKKEKKKRSFLPKAVASVAFGLFFGLSAGISFYAIKEVADYVNPQNTETESALSQENNQTIKKSINDSSEAETKAESIPLATGSSIPDVVDRVMPSVVSITNLFTQTQQDFFGQTFERQGEGSGSGIIVGESDTELLIVTNFHVIGGATQLMVQFIDNEQVEAQVKGTDSSKDLAVIAVQLEDIKDTTQNSISSAELGDSEQLRVGEATIAIGNALGYGQSVTTGVVSAINREVEMDGVSGTFIQTNAAINPGNSGGALLNSQGQVIGINSSKIGGSVVEGMGYAIPISTARPIIENLMTKTTRIKVDESEKGFLGISGVDVTADVSKLYGMPEGVCINQIYENTPASRAGLVKGDIITKFDGSSVSGMTELKAMFDYYGAGTSVEITIMQGSPSGYIEKTITVVLGSQAEANQ